MKKVISKELERALSHALDFCKGEKNEVLRIHSKDKKWFILGTEPLNSLDLMELALLLDGQYEVEKTVEERLKEKRDEYSRSLFNDYEDSLRTQGFDEALKILGITLENS